MDFGSILRPQISISGILMQWNLLLQEQVSRELPLAITPGKEMMPWAKTGEGRRFFAIIAKRGRVEVAGG
jgi:hypothetical protein